MFYFVLRRCETARGAPRQTSQRVFELRADEPQKFREALCAFQRFALVLRERKRWRRLEQAESVLPRGLERERERFARVVGVDAAEHDGEIVFCGEVCQMMNTSNKRSCGWRQR